MTARSGALLNAFAAALLVVGCRSPEVTERAPSPSASPSLSVAAASSGVEASAPKVSWPTRSISDAIPTLHIGPLGFALKPAVQCDVRRGRPIAEYAAAAKRGDACAAEAWADALTREGETVADYEVAASLTAAVLEVRPHVDYWWLCALFDVARDYDRLARCILWLEPWRVSVWHALGLTSLQPRSGDAMPVSLLTQRLQEDTRPEDYPAGPATASDLYCRSSSGSTHDWAACAADDSIIEGYVASIARPLALSRLPKAEVEAARVALGRYIDADVRRRLDSYSIGTSGGVTSMCSSQLRNALRRDHERLLTVLAGLDAPWTFEAGDAHAFDLAIAEDERAFQAMDLGFYRGSPPGSDYRKSYADAKAAFAAYERAVLALARKTSGAPSEDLTRTRLREIRMAALEACYG